MTEKITSLPREGISSPEEPEGGAKSTPHAGEAQGADDANFASSAEAYPEVPATEVLIDDPDFLAALKQLKSISAFLNQVPVGISAQVRQAARLGGLNQLRKSFPAKGRSATFAEWQAVEHRTLTIWEALSEPHRRKFLATQTPGWISYLIFAFVAAAAGSLVVAVLLRTGSIPTFPGGILISFLVWIIALGAIGAAASIGMNALAVQDDATFDMSSGKFIWLRLVLGALFGTVLTLPLGFNTFDDFLNGLTTGKTTADVAKQAGLLLLPFILGFSTSLVILVLNRLIESAQTFFGKSSGK